MNPYFIAVDLSPSIRRQLASICYGLPDVEWIEEENFHLLLRYLGPLSESTLFLVKEALDTISFFPFTLTLKGIRHFHTKGGKGALWVDVAPPEPIIQLKKEIDKSLKGIETEPSDRSFSPHVVLGRYEQINSRRLEEYLVINGFYKSEAFEVQEFVLCYMQRTPKRLFHQKVETYVALPPDIYSE